ncbi:MAG: hypothetical protein HY343_11575 [Lentisphaerae bacterium]|nr:hypothetical protein [Lentisphaerota bacterium]
MKISLTAVVAVGALLGGIGGMVMIGLLTPACAGEPAAAGPTGCPLVPIPKEYEETGGAAKLAGDAVIVIGANATEPEKYAAERLQGLIERRFKRKLAVVTEDKAGEVKQPIVLGQASTSERVKTLCDQQKIDLSELAGKSASQDGFVIEVLDGGKTVLVGGSNPRGVIYGAEAFFDLLRSEGGEVTFPLVSVRDWPSIPWRGRPFHTVERHLAPGVMEAYAHARLNFIDIRNSFSGTGQGTDLSKLPAKKLIEEAHRRGILVYGTVMARGKGEGAARKLFEEFATLGCDGLWASFDDAGGGKDPISFIKMVVEVAGKYGIPGTRLAFTPAAGSYNALGEDERPFAEIPGFAEATFFITKPPTKKMAELAPKLGMKRPPGWWHNWPTYSFGLIPGRYFGGSSFQNRRVPAYLELAPLELGWGTPKYDAIRDAAGNCDTVMLWNGIGTEEYNTTVMGIWAWAPETHDWERTRLAIYGWVFGPAQANAGADFDDRLWAFDKRYGLPTGLKRLKDEVTDPRRLKDVKDRAKALQVIGEMEAALTLLETRAPGESMLEPTRLKEYFLEPMRATATYARKMAELDYPEYALADLDDEILALVEKGQDEDARKRLTEIRERVTAQVEKVATELAGLVRVDPYVKDWKERVSGLDYWKKKLEEKRAANAKK